MRSSVDIGWAPASTATDILIPVHMKEVPIGRLGNAEEVAAAVLWLCGPGSTFVIGHALAVDGGYTVR